MGSMDLVVRSHVLVSAHREPTLPAQSSRGRTPLGVLRLMFGDGARLRLGPGGVGLSLAYRVRLEVVVEHELPRVRPLANLVEFFGSLVVEPDFDQVVGEDAALEQEVMIGL